MRKSILLVYLLALIVLGAYIFSIRQDFLGGFAVKNIFLVLLSFLVLLLFFPLNALRMKVFLSSIDNTKISFIQLLKLEFVNRAAMFFLPSRLNVPIKAAYLHLDNRSEERRVGKEC